MGTWHPFESFTNDDSGLLVSSITLQKFSVLPLFSVPLYGESPVFKLGYQVFLDQVENFQKLIFGKLCLQFSWYFLIWYSFKRLNITNENLKNRFDFITYVNLKIGFKIFKKTSFSRIGAAGLSLLFSTFLWEVAQENWYKRTRRWRSIRLTIYGFQNIGFWVNPKTKQKK